MFVHLLALGGFSSRRLIKRVLGITAAKMHFVRATGIPLSHEGLCRKLGRSMLQYILRR